jgi:hypothetical protein
MTTTALDRPKKKKKDIIHVYHIHNTLTRPNRVKRSMKSILSGFGTGACRESAPIRGENRIA